MDWQKEMQDPQEFAATLKADLFEDEVFVFTPKGEVKSLGGGATPLDFAYAVHTDVGHRCVGAKVNGKIVPLHYELQSGDICEVLTSKKERGPSRDWLSLVKTTRAQSKIRAWFKAERREDSERTGREILQESLKRQGLPPQRIAGSPLLAEVIREIGFKKADDFYIALGASKVSAKVVTQKVMQRLREGDSAVEAGGAAAELEQRREVAKPTGAASSYGIRVEGIDDVMLRLAKCCRPVPGRPDPRLHLARQGHHDPPRGVHERQGADEEPGALHARLVGGRQRRRGLPGRDRGGRVGPHPPAGGPLAHLRRDRHQHPRGALHHGRPDGQEPVRGRGGRRGGAEDVHPAAAEHRVGLRRVSRDADGLSGGSAPTTGQARAAARRTPPRRTRPMKSPSTWRGKGRSSSARTRAEVVAGKPEIWRWRATVDALPEKARQSTVGSSTGVARRSTVSPSVPSSSPQPWLMRIGRLPK